ncbi:MULTISPECIES: cytochrome c [unclassified Polaromonas]|jgi:mono/diheme cytochrome c family protein|uniref:c-type cytochrome n=1 Tax=unclassified Polaromonas TaxID=2638319 RepID=UPI000BD7FB25|nr:MULTISPECIES: cytochrome c [unclassified Polaromonas]OYY36503.1 MAG: cytochrome C [Polaromonas sp. 35-63-35]OYZ22738.1 MAG: cytochrome C [Polaromonas sp. 16-63-31]OYZ81049.1 MAG: cytochrome C [Polaromonas sp. 24-63-21]OZA52732.1 MAG: cytochrome C [Polaromonas sp. 17-63-33]OZA88413.1 MAG: cytochrome C [Polaromonas sp. 39-63-25]
MKRWVKWVLGAGAALVVLAAGATLVGTELADQKAQRLVKVNVRPVAFPADAQSLERGKYLFNSRGCVDCHGVNGAGREFVNDGHGLRLAGPNITPGEGKVVARYTSEDWVRTLRHGVKPDGRPLFVMPSEDYNRFTDADLGALVAYVRSLPPQPGGATVLELSLPVKLLYGFDAIEDAAQKIDHSLPPATAVAEGVTVAHGAYVANMCISCHGAGLSGGKIPGAPPDWAPAANLTPGDGSAMTRYKDAGQFVAMLRSGKRPDGAVVTVMPFESLRELNDVDAQALYAYLKTVPARPFGQR